MSQCDRQTRGPRARDQLKLDRMFRSIGTLSARAPSPHQEQRWRFYEMGVLGEDLMLAVDQEYIYRFRDGELACDLRLPREELHCKRREA